MITASLLYTLAETSAAILASANLDKIEKELMDHAIKGYVAKHVSLAEYPMLVQIEIAERLRDKGYKVDENPAGCPPHVVYISWAKK